MSDSEHYCLHSVSVVVTAKYHSPSVLNPGFLESKGIVPQGWDVNEAITTPPMSIVNYSQGIRWDVNQATLTVTEDCSPSQSEFLVHRQVSAYVRALPHVPYQGLGLNCVLSFAAGDPVTWLTRRFLKSGPWRKGNFPSLKMAPKFSFVAEDATCNLSMNPGILHPEEGGNRPAVIINSNLHHEGPLDPEGLCAAMARWEEKQSSVISALDVLLKGPRR